VVAVGEENGEGEGGEKGDPTGSGHSVTG
jgi:hypothetical protein